MSLKAAMDRERKAKWEALCKAKRKAKLEAEAERERTKKREAERKAELDAKRELERAARKPDRLTPLYFEHKSFHEGSTSFYYTNISFKALYRVDALTHSPKATGNAAIKQLFAVGETMGFFGDCKPSSVEKFRVLESELKAMRDDGTLDVQTFEQSWSACGWDDGNKKIFYINGDHVLEVTHGKEGG